jgi:hypothetical protein
MNCFKLLALLPTLFIVLVSTSVANEYTIPEHGVLEFSAPSGLSDSVEQSRDGSYIGILLMDEVKRQYAVFIRVSWHAAQLPNFGSQEQLVSVLERELAAYIEQGAKTEGSIKQLDGGKNIGYAISLVDPPAAGTIPDPDDFPYIREGVVKVENLLLNYSILMYSREPDPAPKIEDALLEAIIHTEAGSQ